MEGSSLKLLLATVVLAASLFAGAQAATANPPPPHLPPLPPDEIAVTDEPEGENCPNGGVKIVVTHYEWPVIEPPVLEETILPPPPKPEPVAVEEVFFVCNGIDGEPGEPGEPGIPGTPGLPGATIIGPSGIPNNINISQDVEVNVNVNGQGGRRCRFAREPRLRLPERLASQSSVLVRVDRGRLASAAVNNGRVVVERMRGKRCGPHVVVARKQGVEPTVRLWTVISRTQLNRRVLVA
jgi:hypothetical protein